MPPPMSRLALTGLLLGCHCAALQEAPLRARARARVVAVAASAFVPPWAAAAPCAGTLHARTWPALAARQPVLCGGTARALLVPNPAAGIARNVGVRRAETRLRGAASDDGGPESTSSWLKRMSRDPTFMQFVAWGGFACILALLKPFYGVMAGTFIMAFVGNSIVHMWEQTVARLKGFAAGKGYNIWCPSRRVLATAYCCLMLTVLSVGSCITVPLVFDSWRYLKSVLLSDNPYVELANSIYNFLGPEATSRVESLLAAIFGEPSKQALKSLASFGDAPALTWQLQLSLKGSVAACLPFFNKLLKGGSQVFAQFMASLLFSFILIYDHPRIQRGVQRLGSKQSTIAPLYNEVAPRVSFFGQLVGKSLEAQLMIALWNTFLTTCGLWLLGVSGAAFFSVLVFVCSFIPLLGVLLSTMPMGIVALGEYGVHKMAQVWLMVFAVHVFEAYFLNPQIYSSKLKLHPILVLVALYVTEHCFGIGALFLAVPVTVFAIHAVLGGISAAKTAGNLNLPPPPAGETETLTRLKEN